jgi:hypothetical protein
MDENIPERKYFSSQVEDTFSLPPSFLHPRRNNILVAFYILPERNISSPSFHLNKGFLLSLPFLSLGKVV